MRKGALRFEDARTLRPVRVAHDNGGRRGETRRRRLEEIHRILRPRRNRENRPRARRVRRFRSEPGMGGTIILWQALRGGQIDVYPEYTGTIGEEILKTKQPLSRRRDARGARRNSTSACPRTSASTTPTRSSCAATEADRLGIRTISDLRAHPELKVRADARVSRSAGWLASARRAPTA